MKNKLTIFSIILLLGFSCRNNRGGQFEFCPKEFTPDEQLLIGEKIAEVLHQNEGLFPILDQADYPEAYSYLSKLLNTAVLTPHVFYRDKFDWEVHIIHNDDKETAFFLPGGSFYIYTGLLKFLETESQLLSIIAHELYYTNSDLIPLSIYDGLDECNVLGDVLIGKEQSEDLEVFAERMPELVFETDLVERADSFSIALLCDFRYDVLGMKEIIFLAETQNDTIQWLQNRPMESFEERIEYNIIQALNCDLGGIRNEENYQFFLENNLP